MNCPQILQTMRLVMVTASPPLATSDTAGAHTHAQAQHIRYQQGAQLRSPGLDRLQAVAINARTANANFERREQPIQLVNVDVEYLGSSGPPSGPVQTAIRRLSSIDFRAGGEQRPGSLLHRRQCQRRQERLAASTADSGIGCFGLRQHQRGGREPGV